MRARSRGVEDDWTGSMENLQWLDDGITRAIGRLVGATRRFGETCWMMNLTSRQEDYSLSTADSEKEG